MTEEEIDSVYKYLSIFYDELSQEDLEYWIAILEENDPDFYTDTEDDEI
jgi:succinate dehydrogenase flavin-adding protein (antitoxin of CptAB toxin-antitoxin module)